VQFREREFVEVRPEKNSAPLNVLCKDCFVPRNDALQEFFNNVFFNGAQDGYAVTELPEFCSFLNSVNSGSDRISFKVRDRRKNLFNNTRHVCASNVVGKVSRPAD